MIDISWNGGVGVTNEYSIRDRGISLWRFGRGFQKTITVIYNVGRVEVSGEVDMFRYLYFTIASLCYIKYEKLYMRVVSRYSNENRLMKDCVS